MSLLEAKQIKLELKLSMACLLLEAKCNVNVHYCGKMVLFWACNGDILPKNFTQIVALDAELTTKDSKGMAALHLCIYHGCLLEKIQCLLINGINVDVKNRSGETPLHMAAVLNIKVITLCCCLMPVSWQGPRGMIWFSWKFYMKEN